MAKNPRAQFITVKRPSMVKDDKLYFIMRRGGYYRPSAEGYCDNFADAGVWFGKEAKKHLSTDGVTLHPVQPLLPVVRAELASHIRRAHSLSVLIDRL